jgi:hypothetical protein
MLSLIQIIKTLSKCWSLFSYWSIMNYYGNKYHWITELSSNPLHVIIRGESRHIFRYTVGDMSLTSVESSAVKSGIGNLKRILKLEAKAYNYFSTVSHCSETSMRTGFHKWIRLLFERNLGLGIGWTRIRKLGCINVMLLA